MQHEVARLSPSHLEASFDNQPLLTVRGLAKRFGGQLVLDGLDLDIHRGDVVILRGENGSGKTTLLNMLTGIIEPDAGAICYAIGKTLRRYKFPRRWWQELNPFDHFTPEFVARQGIGRTWQDIRLFDGQTLRDNINVANAENPGEDPLAVFTNWRKTRNAEEIIKKRSTDFLVRLDLGGYVNAYADSISMGQAKRAAIARAVVAGAQVLFLDEPLSGLDKNGIASVVELLKEIIRDEKLTLIMVEHVYNQSHLRPLATKDWLLERGKLVESRIEPAPKTSLSAQTARTAWAPLRAGENAAPDEEPLPRGALLTRMTTSAFQQKNQHGEPILEVRNLVVRRGRRTIVGHDDGSSLGGFNMTLSAGEIAILEAPNGWGKTTLFLAICGLIPTSSGEIRFNGADASVMATWTRARSGLTAVPALGSTFPSLTVRDHFALTNNGKIEDALRPFEKRICSSLSGGERQRVALSAALRRLTPGSLLMLDEPLAALDQEATRLFLAELAKKAGQSAVLIFVPRQF